MREVGRYTLPPGEPTPRTSKPLVSAETVAALTAARASRPSIQDSKPETDEAGAARRHTIKMAVMLIAAAVIASLLTLAVQKLL